MQYDKEEQEQQEQHALLPLAGVERIRRVIHEAQEYWSVIDVIAYLTDAATPSKYWNTMRNRMQSEGARETLSQIIQLPMRSADGRLRKTDAMTRSTLLRLVQSIPSPKAEPFKLFLAEAGEEILTEAEQQSSTLEGLRDHYRRLHRDEEWITARILYIATRNAWTSEIQLRGVGDSPSIARLTSLLNWCPLCYEEWRETGQVIYQPLIWQFPVINHCSQHNASLHLQCPYKDCRRALPPLAPRFQPGYCTHCDRWLGHRVALKDCLPMSSNSQERQIWVQQAVGEMLATMPGSPSILSQAAFATIISTYVNRAMGGNYSEFARRVQFHRRTVWEWAQGLQIPPLDALLQICSYFGMTPLHLLTGNIHEVEQVQKNKLTMAQPRGKFRRFETEELREALEQVLRSEESPPLPMREVARRLNYDQSHLRRHFPDLCRAISTRYLTFQQEQRQRRLQKTGHEVGQAIRTLYENGDSLSERQVGKLLIKRGVLKEKEVRKALKSSLLELGERNEAHAYR